MKVHFLTPAILELDEAIQYYDHQLPGLGYRFFQEVSSSVARVQATPNAWTKIGKHTRRCLLKGFPYALLYVASRKEILITAVANLHRNPEHYKERIT